MDKRPARRRERSQRIQIYLIPSVEKDALILDVWKTAMASERNQDFFRDLLWKAVRDAHFRGDIPPEIEKRCKVSQRVGPGTPQAPAMPQMIYMQPPMSYPAPYPPQGPVPEPAYVPAPAPIYPPADGERPDRALEAEPEAPPQAMIQPVRRPPGSDPKSKDTTSRLLALMGDD